MSVQNRKVFDDLSHNLSVTSTNTPFSKMAYDQCHEQNNKDIKSSSGYINLVNNEDTSYLPKLEICLPDFHHFLDTKESKQSHEDKPMKHKEQYDSFIRRYMKDYKKVYEKITLNQFVTKQFKKLSTPHLSTEAIVQVCDKVFEVGQHQYASFKNERFIRGSISIATKISKNQLKLPKDKDRVSKSSPHIKLSNTLITKLCDACYY